MSTFPWESPVPYLLFGAMAIAAMAGTFVLIVGDIRRKQASPLLGVAACVGMAYVGLLFLAIAADNGALRPLLSRYPQQARTLFTLAIDTAFKALCWGLSCCVVSIALVGIVASPAIVVKFRDYRWFRALSLLPAAYWRLAEQRQQLSRSARVELWLAHVVSSLCILYWGGMGIWILLGYNPSPVAAYWGWTGSLILMAITHPRIWDNRLAKKLNRQLSSPKHGGDGRCA